jgi:uncharacterized membrane protein YagU involved in acid resistance
MTSAKPKPSFLKTIIITWLIAGSLDILAAIFMSSVILHKAPALKVLQSVASGVFGAEAYRGGIAMALAGLGFHFLIALIFTVIYFLIFPYLAVLRSQKIISGLIYGIVVWMIMNLAVLPLSNIPKLTYHWPAMIRGSVVLMLCIGLPISILVSRYYSAQPVKTK